MYQGIRIAGFGGQGVISAGILLAQAGVENKKERQLVAVLRAGNARRYGELFRSSVGRRGLYADCVCTGYGYHYERAVLAQV